MQYIDVRFVVAEPAEAMKQVSRLEHRRVEGFAVEADQRPRVRALAGDGLEHRALVRVARHHVLPRDEAVALEPRAPDEERVRAGAAVQAGRFQVEEDEWWTGGRAAGKKRRLR